MSTPQRASGGEAWQRPPGDEDRPPRFGDVAAYLIGVTILGYLPEDVSRGFEGFFASIGFIVTWVYFRGIYSKDKA